MTIRRRHRCRSRSASSPIRARPGAKESGGLEQTLDARARKSGKYETFDAYFSRPFQLDPSKVRLRRLGEGARVIGGTVSAVWAGRPSAAAPA